MASKLFTTDSISKVWIFLKMYRQCKFRERRMNGFVYVKKKINYNYRPFLKTVYKVCLFHHCIFNKRSDSYRFFLSVLINACYLKVSYLKRQPKIFKSCRKICNSYNTVMFVTRTPKYTILRKRSLTRKHPTPISCIPYISTPTCCL